MSKITFDVDIDMKDREQILKYIKHIPAASIRNNEITRHNTGVYIQNIPSDPISGCAAYDFNEAEELGYLKIDFLNMSVYEMVRDEAHLNALMSKEPNWSKLLDRNFTMKLVHLNNHYRLTEQMKPSSIKEMAMLLAVIRPGKQYLQGRPWNEIEKEVWTKTDNYSFKHSHGISYAILVGVHMNLLEEQGY